MVKINDYLNIKIYKYKSNGVINFFFFKNDYLLCHIVEHKDVFIFIEFKIKNAYSYISRYSNYMQNIELYEFLFSDDINRLFLNRIKPITYQGNMQYALKIDKELKEYFQNIIENE